MYIANPLHARRPRPAPLHPYTPAPLHVARQADKKLLYIATNMECSDPRLARMSKMLEQRAVRTVCGQEQARQELGSDDNYFLSVVEQARGICTRTTYMHMHMHTLHMHCTHTMHALRTLRDTLHFTSPLANRSGAMRARTHLHRLQVLDVDRHRERDAHPRRAAWQPAARQQLALRGTVPARSEVTGGP